MRRISSRLEAGSVSPRNAARTRISAVLGLRPMSKGTVTEAEPGAVLDIMCPRLRTPKRRCSTGMVSSRSTVSAACPGALIVIRTTGAAMSGNNAVGSRQAASTPETPISSHAATVKRG